MHFTQCDLWDSHGQVLRLKWDEGLGASKTGDELLAKEGVGCETSYGFPNHNI